MLIQNMDHKICFALVVPVVLEDSTLLKNRRCKSKLNTREQPYQRVAFTACHHCMSPIVNVAQHVASVSGRKNQAVHLVERDVYMDR